MVVPTELAAQCHGLAEHAFSLGQLILRVKHVTKTVKGSERLRMFIAGHKMRT